MKKTLIFLLLVIGFQYLQSQVLFHKGVNLTGWFQAENARSIQFRKFTKKDFVEIKSLGCDVIRLPINLHGMTNGAPDYIIDPLLFTFLDSTINWAEELQIHLIIDNHSFDPAMNTSPNIGQTLRKVWPQIAERYKDRSNYIYYEILNEPHGISNQLWGNIQLEAINSIRAVDTKHTIIVGPSGYNSYNDLAQMPIYTDTNLIYTFHFYDPFMFTHQGASWNTPSMVSLAGVPFPYNAATMPVCPPNLIGTWVEQALNNYPNDGTVQKVKSLIDIAVNFRNMHNVKIFCGEFGVYIPNSDTADRVFWYETVKDYLEEKTIPWTIWDYKGGFGLFEKGSNELFDNDLNVPLLKALDFNVPEQHSFILHPDSTGFIMYDDYIGQNIIESSYSTAIDYYSTNFPNNDHYCMYWTKGPQYNTITLDFAPNKDLSQLFNSNYAIDLLVRATAADTRFDIRFVDTKTSEPNDHPWRMRKTISSSECNWDKRWHHLHLPLNEFAEQGSWDQGQWFNPEGKFDWTAIDKFEIVAEYGNLNDKEIWFDNIFVSNQDTASILEPGTLSKENPSLIENSIGLFCWPNPLENETSINCEIAGSGIAILSVFNSQGRLIKEIVNQYLSKGNYTFNWNGLDMAGNPVMKGLYICQLTNLNTIKHCKLLKI